MKEHILSLPIRNKLYIRRLSCLFFLFLPSISAFCNLSLNLSPSRSLQRKILLLRSTDNDEITNQQRYQEDIETLMMKHDPILLFVSRLLPASVSLDASALYAWCRRLDEITDNPNTDILILRQELDDWENRFDSLWNGNPKDGMDAALYECFQRNKGKLDKEIFYDMIAGMKADAGMDTSGSAATKGGDDEIRGIKRRISTMKELEIYAYQVAGTVGLMLLPLLDAPDVNSAREPAICLGKAIQLINILRDATPDAELGRIYLPQDLLQANGVNEDDVLALLQPPSDGYRSVVKSVADRANELLVQAEAGKSTLPGLGPLFVQIIIELYRGYLEQLEKLEYNNLIEDGEERRVKISKTRKLAASVTAVGKTLFGT